MDPVGGAAPSQSAMHAPNPPSSGHLTAKHLKSAPQPFWAFAQVETCSEHEVDTMHPSHAMQSALAPQFTPELELDEVELVVVPELDEVELVVVPELDEVELVAPPVTPLLVCELVAPPAPPVPSGRSWAPRTSAHAGAARAAPMKASRIQMRATTTRTLR